MSSLNLNKVVLAGRLTADPELKQTQNGISMCSFSIAVNRRFRREGEQNTDFINCKAWRNIAEFICKYLRKGSSVCVTGSIQSSNWTDSNGQKRYSVDLVVEDAMFVDSKNEAQQTEASNQSNYMPDAYKDKQAPEFEAVDPDERLPF